MKDFVQTVLIVLTVLLATTASAATFSYDVKVTGISGGGEAENRGLYQTRSVGEVGSGFAIVADTEPVFADVLELSDFGVNFGSLTAATFFLKTFNQSTALGQVEISGFLGGLTVSSSADLVSADAFSFIFENPSYTTDITTGTQLADFLSGAEMSGFISAEFFYDGATPADDVSYLQRLEFTSIAAVPLPAGGVLLLTALSAGLGLRRIRN